MTPKQSFVAEFTEAGAHLPLSKNTVNSLARFAVKADEETLSALRGLLAQPDPHGSVAVVLPFRLRNAQADYTEIDENDFAHWIKSANACFHAVDEFIIGTGRTEKCEDETYMASRFAQGARHYRESGDSYSDAQIKDLALIAAAAHFVSLATEISDRDRATNSITAYAAHGKSDHYVGHEDFWCHSVANQRIRQLATSSPQMAAEILRVIVDNDACTEAEILYYLNGGHSALVDGLI